MAKKSKFVNIVLWLVGVMVALAVGFGMTSGLLVVPIIPVIVTQIAGWIVVIGTIIGAVMTVLSK